MKPILILALGLFMGRAASAGKNIPPTPELQSAIKAFTDGKIIKVEEGHKRLAPTYEVDIESANQSVKEIEVTRKSFELVEAEGRSLEPASFKPGSGLSSLADLSAALKKYPDFSAHKWSLEKNLTGHWVYEVSGIEKGVEREYHFNAADLSLLKVKND